MFDLEDVFAFLKPVAIILTVLFCGYVAVVVLPTGDLGLVLKMVFYYVLAGAALCVALLLLNLLLGYWSERWDGGSILGILLAVLFIVGSSLLMHQVGYHAGFRVMTWATGKIEAWLEQYQMPLPDVSGAQNGCGVAGVVAGVLVGLLSLIKLTSVRSWIPTLVYQCILTFAFCFYTHFVLLLLIVVFSVLLCSGIGKVLDAINFGYKEYRDGGYGHYKARNESVKLLNIMRFFGRKPEE